MNMILYMGTGGSLLILAVIAFRRLFLRKAPKSMLVFLWLIVLARLLIPLAIPVSWYPAAGSFGLSAESSWAEANGQSLSLPPYTVASDVLTETKSQKPVRFQPVLLLLSVWLFGMTVTFVAILRNHLKWLKIYRMSLPVIGQDIVEWQQLHSGHRQIQIRQSDQIHSPLTYGLFRPVILLPEEYSRENRDELSYILTHEWIHIRRAHVAVKYAVCFAVSIYWFNPLVWIMSCLLDRDLELSCDEEVIRPYDRRSKKEYAMLLIRQAEKSSALLPTGVCFSKHSELEERIEAIMNTTHYSSKLVMTATALILCMAATFTVSAQETRETEPVSGAAFLLNTVIPSLKTSPMAPEASWETPKAAVSGNNTTSVVSGEDIVRLAESYLGAPYQYGGTDLYNGIDCSGFVTEIYGKAGIILPHPMEQLAEEGTLVPSDTAVSGDVVLYSRVNEDNSSTLVHVAIYAGNGQVIHASNVKDGVKMSNIDYRTPYQIMRILK